MSYMSVWKCDVGRLKLLFQAEYFIYFKTCPEGVFKFIRYDFFILLYDSFLLVP